METMGSRVVPSGVGSLDNSLSHPITLRAPPPLPSPNLPNTTTTVSPCSLGSHHQSHYNDTITGFYWVNEERERDGEKERETERRRERGDGGVLFTWRALQSLRIFYGCTVSLEQTSVGVYH